MRRFQGTALALAIPAVLISSLTFAGQASAASCAANGSVTLVRENDLRIYRVDHTVWVCSTLYGRRIRMARSASHVDLWKRPGQRTFAYAIAAGLGNKGVFGSRDLKTGALLRGHMVLQYFSMNPVDLVAKRDGSIAYIYSWVGGSTHDQGNSVEKVDKTGLGTLDGDCVLCSNSINLTSLRVVGNTVQWIDNSVVRSAPFK